jgi:hypothetical protein
MLGGYGGGQAQYARVPFADVGCMPVPDHLKDEQVLFLPDVVPTAFHSTVLANVQEGDTVGVWGAGPIGGFESRDLRQSRSFLLLYLGQVSWLRCGASTKRLGV